MVSGLHKVSPLSPMPLEGLKGKYQTQEPALTSLRPAAATTERHIQPQTHSCSLPTDPCPFLISAVSQAQSQPPLEHACTIPLLNPRTRHGQTSSSFSSLAWTSGALSTMAGSPPDLPSLSQTQPHQTSALLPKTFLWAKQPGFQPHCPC